MSGPSIDRANSSGDIWTPRVFTAAVERKFRPLHWDLAATAASRKAPRWFGAGGDAEDSLTVDWHKCVVVAPPKEFSLAGVMDSSRYSRPLLWLNPPYSNITPWAKKCFEEWKLGAEILLLVPMGSQNWYWEYVEPYAQVYCVGRMVFDNCFDKKGKLVRTNYPKDLILAHYVPGKHSNRPVRWRWQDA